MSQGTPGLSSSQQIELVAFFDATRNHASGYARRVGLQKEDGQDAQSDFLLTLLQRPPLIDQYERPQKLASVNRRILNLLRQAKRIAPLPETTEHTGPFSVDPSQEGAVLFQESLTCIRRVCTSREKEIIGLFLGGSNFTEIAALLGITPQAAKQAFDRAVRRCQDLLSRRS